MENEDFLPLLPAQEAVKARIKPESFKDFLDRKNVAGAKAIGMITILVEYGYIPKHHLTTAKEILAEFNRERVVPDFSGPDGVADGTVDHD